MTPDQLPLPLDMESWDVDDLEALLYPTIFPEHPGETVEEDVSKRGASRADSETTTATYEPPDNLEPLEFDNLVHLQAREGVQARWPRPELQVKMAFHQRSVKQVSNAPVPMLMFLYLHLRFCLPPTSEPHIKPEGHPAGA